MIDDEVLPAHARGCAILGTGGGGAPKIGLLAARQAIADHGPVPLVDLDDLPDDEMVMPIGMLGAPTVSIEKISNGDEGVWLRDAVEKTTGRKVAAVMPSEIGGSNGCSPIAWAAKLGLPLVDGDGMGRAFPEMPQVAMEVAGVDPSPCLMVDERRNTLVTWPTDGAWLERICRANAVAFGGRAVSSEYLMTVAQARHSVVRGSVTLAMEIGRALEDAVGDPVDSLLDKVRGFRLIEGKITDVDRRTTGGFVRGSVIVEGLRGDSGRLLRLELQNENLIALEDGQLRACVPDLITVLDTQTADAIPTELLRYGQRVTVIAFGCDPVWRTERGLALTGPRAFDYDLDYVPVEELHREAVR
ncbi:MAG: DUF917 family protein [Streptosporangiales bacterium]|nr:DUF917 family protein [Streptosporangiales bacterium]